MPRPSFYHDDPNAPETLKPLNPRDPRHLDLPADGPEAGYHRPYRRPRSAMTDDCLPSDKADRVESFDRDIQSMMDDYND